jgi:hypothetical protein
MVNLKLELDREDRAAEHEPEVLRGMNQVKHLLAILRRHLRTLAGMSLNCPFHSLAGTSMC